MPCSPRNRTATPTGCARCSRATSAAAPGTSASSRRCSTPASITRSDAMKNTFIGQPMERREDLRFLRGRGEYVDDVSMPGLLYAVILRSSVAHGRLVSVDASAALKIDGVHAVVTAADMKGGVPIVPMRLQPLPEFKPFEQPVIAHDKVRYVGEPIAVVLATSFAVAEDALEAVEVT